VTSSTTTVRSQPHDGRLVGVRRIALVPAHNEELTVAGVVDEIKAFDLDFEVLVIDDGSTDRTAELAEGAGAHVVQLPYNLGIGGAVQTGIQYARNHDFDLAVQVDGDAQHPPGEIPKLLEPIIEDRADITLGSRLGTTRNAGALPWHAVFGNRLAAGLIRRLRVTDTTSGFRAMNRRAIRLFAGDYPHDYPEVEATVLVFRHRLRLLEVPVQMRMRTSGDSSIRFHRSAYYMLKVMLALFVGLFRRYPTPQEEP